MGGDVKLYRSGARSLTVEADVTVAGGLDVANVQVAGVELKELIQNILNDALKTKTD